MGIMTIHGKPVAITIASLPSNGDHGTGTSNLTRIAKWFVAHADIKGLPTHCN